MTNRRSVLAVAAVASFDPYARYCETMRTVYGPRACPTRAQWDAACKTPRRRALTDNEIDDNREAVRNGELTIYG